MSVRAAVSSALLCVVACAPAKDAPPPVTEAPAPTELAIHASDNSFAAPDTVVPGVTRIRLTNEGQHPHHAILARIDSGKTMADVAAAVASGDEPGWVVFVGGAGAAMPGQEVSTVATLTPGNYVLICFLQDAPDQPPHAAMGMVRPLVVAGEPGLATLPAATAEIQMVDFDFGSPVLTAGEQVIRVVNNGTETHEVMMFPMPEGMTLEAFQQELMTGEPSGGVTGGNGALSPGQSNLWLTSLAPGNYALVCFVPSPGDKVPHVMKGMIKQITVPVATS